MRTKEKMEYRRKCHRDDTVWYVPEELHDKPRAAMVGSRGGETAARKGALTVAYIEAKRCPICGSQSYVEDVVNY